MMLGKASSPFCIPVARQCLIDKYTKFESNKPSGSIVIGVFTDLKFSTDAQQSLVHQKRLLCTPVIRQC